MSINLDPAPYTEILKTLKLFSKKWEPYVQSCQDDLNPNLFRVTKEHDAYDLLINQLPKEFEKVLDTEKYKVVSSVGDGNLAGIPWLCILDKSITESVTQEYYVSLLFSRNAKKAYLSLGFGAQQFFDIFGENELCLEKIQSVKESVSYNMSMWAPLCVEEGEEFKGFDEIDLWQKKDKEFIRNSLSKKIGMKIDGYTNGSFYTKEYSLNDINVDDISEDDETSLKYDFGEYLNSYDRLKDNSVGELIKLITEAKAEAKKNTDLDYEIPDFIPSKISEGKGSKKNSNTKTNRRYSPESKKTGAAGEEHVYDYEYNKLKKIGREDLAKKIIHQSKDTSSYPGYDICSFDEDGNEIYIEVKSSKGRNKKTFDITTNEWDSAIKNKEKYFIFIVENALKKPKIIARIKDPENYVKNSKIKISPSRYKMDI